MLVVWLGSIDWTSIRRSIGNLKGRIEYCLVEDPKEIKAGIALNEKMAGLTFPDTTGKLDFNRGFESNNYVFRKWCVRFSLCSIGAELGKRYIFEKLKKMKPTLVTRER